MIILRNKNFSLISKGIRFFKELKKIENLPITKEEFCEILSYYISKKEKDRYRYKELVDKINTYYKNPIAARGIIRIGRSILGSWTLENNINPASFIISYKNPIFRNGCDFAYNFLIKLPKRYILDSLGSGGFGVVFDYPFNRVEKISFKGFTDKELMFYKYLLKNPTPRFPKIYTLESDQVIMEKLDTDSPKVQKYKEWINKYVERRIDPNSGKFTPYRECNKELLEKELGKNHEFYKFINDIEDALYKIYGIKTIGDLSRSNIGERRKTGEIIFFDPVGGKIIM